MDRQLDPPPFSTPFRAVEMHVERLPADAKMGAKSFAARAAMLVKERDDGVRGGHNKTGVKPRRSWSPGKTEKPSPSMAITRCVAGRSF